MKHGAVRQGLWFLCASVKADSVGSVTAGIKVRTADAATLLTRNPLHLHVARLDAALG